MDLLTNAIESVRLGVEDYETGSHARLIASVRNIHAGILLFFKEALRRRSPMGSNDVLIKARIVPALDTSGAIVFVGEGNKTADTVQIRDRFKALGIAADWRAFEGIAATRNEVEHYYPKLKPEALQRVVATAFAIIRDFVTTELHEEPRTLLGEKTWQVMLTVSAVYEKERDICHAAIESATWPSEVVRRGVSSVACPECGSELLEPKAPSENWNSPVLECRSCGATLEPDVFVPIAVSLALGREMHLSAADGDPVPYTQCPECSEDTYIVDERCCALCGASVQHECAMCGSEILPEELETSPYCGWCSHMLSKDD